MSALVDRYRDALASANVVENADGILVYRLQDETGEYSESPFTIEGMHSVLPHKENLTSDKLKTLVAFHPLSESVIRGESEVLQRLRKMFCLRFKMVFGELAEWMLHEATNPAAAKKYSPKQKQFFDILADATPKTLKTFEHVLTKSMQGDSTKSMVNIYLKRTGATYEGEKMTRAAIVSFPFLETLETRGKKEYLCDVEVSKKDLNMLLNLFNYLVPGIQNPGELYNYGSRDNTAPYFDSLINCYAKLMENMNGILTLLGNKCPMGKVWFTDISWVAEFSPLSQFRGQIPKMPYNEGKALNVTPDPTDAEKVIPGQPTPTKLPNNNLAGMISSVATPPVPSNNPTLDSIMEAANQQQAEQARWSGDSASPVASSSSSAPGGFESLMENVYKKNGIPLPTGGAGFGSTATSTWGNTPANNEASAIRRRVARQQQDANQAWTGISSGGWGR